jgi:hypothetical protein
MGTTIGLGALTGGLPVASTKTDWRGRVGKVERDGKWLRIRVDDLEGRYAFTLFGTRATRHALEVVPD